jgi:DNA-binding response OmpR family regulator
MKLLVVEDHISLQNSIKEGFIKKGFSVDCSSDGEEGLWYAQNHSYDAIILDLMLPKLDGLSVLKQLRADGNSVPTLLLTAKAEIKDRVTGLNLGADDYLTKPFAFSELVARVQALIRRSHSESSNVIEIADLKVDLNKHEVSRNNQNIKLTKREFSLLEFLVLHKNQVVSKLDILDGVFDTGDDKSTNLVDVYISYLRRKIDDPYETKLIQTKWGHGFIFGVEE